MSNAQIMDVITEEILAILPQLNRDEITPDARMADLGADSLDRSEVVQQSMRKLGIRLRPSELTGVENIGGLAARFAAALQTA